MPQSSPLPPLRLPPQSPGPALREVVDEAGRPLCLLPEAVLLRQGLRHRAVALAIFDAQGRALLRPGADGWDFSSRALPQAMEATEDCCRRLLEAEWRLAGIAPRVLRRVDACAETGMAFLTLFAARIAVATAREMAAPGAFAPEGLPLLDAVELAGLAGQEPPILAPLLRHAVRAGWLAEQK
ncbi:MULTISPECIES: NUDIX hydrolase [unclassified Desulfovibrio]|uniref:NUDIX hydrolase n=1 Tax=unclassified Desulfovibrio TaxID=2593640 RepID=UPI0013EAC159|nr:MULTISPECIES: NUDIX hydrolase [unclassified Desulfovibrio]